MKNKVIYTICTNCGAEITRNNLKVCNKCGERLVYPDPPTSKANKNESEPIKKDADYIRDEKTDATSIPKTNADSSELDDVDFDDINFDEDENFNIDEYTQEETTSNDLDEDNEDDTEYIDEDYNSEDENGDYDADFDEFDNDDEEDDLGIDEDEEDEDENDWDDMQENTNAQEDEYNENDFDEDDNYDTDDNWPEEDDEHVLEDEKEQYDDSEEYEIEADDDFEDEEYDDINKDEIEDDDEEIMTEEEVEDHPAPKAQKKTSKSTNKLYDAVASGKKNQSSKEYTSKKTRAIPKEKKQKALSESIKTKNIKKHNDVEDKTTETYDPNYDGYYDDILPLIDDAIFRIPKDIIFKAIFVIIAVLTSIIYLIYNL